MRKRQKRSPKDILHDKALKVFRKWIRKRDKKCITCKGLAENCGHFWHNVLDFDPENNNGQCVRCNKWLSGNLAVYAVRLIEKIGIKKFKALDLRHSRALSGEYKTEKDYQDLIKKYE